MRGFVSPRAAQIALSLREAEDSTPVAEAFDISRQNIATQVRIVEQRAGVKLFHRQRGAGHTEWLPLAERESAWRRIERVAA
jgi:hypothetical protein